MPDWLITALVPILIPSIVACAKKVAAELGARIPRAVLLPLIAAVAEIVSRGADYWAGAGIPAGYAAVIAMAVREVYEGIRNGIEGKPLDAKRTLAVRGGANR